MPTLAQLHAADPTRGYSTPFYEAMTNSGDVAARFNAAPGQEVRLVDPKTGQVYASGSGPEGAQQIATLATQLGSDLGRKAQWQIQTAQGDGSYTTVGYDRYDPKKTGLLNTVIKIAAPLLGAAIPGLAPFLGAALGGFGGDLATGGNLKSAALAGVAGGLGNSLGGAASGLLRGTPVSFSGVNALGGLGGSLGGGGGGALAGGAGMDALAGGALGDALGTVAPVTVMGGMPSALGAGLAGAGGAVGSVLSGGATSAATGGGGLSWDQLAKDPAMQKPAQNFNTPQAGDDWAGLADFIKNLPGLGNTVAPVDVMGGQSGGITPPLTGYYDVPGLQGTDMAGINNSSFANDQTGQTVEKPPLLDPMDLAGNTAGGVAGDMITGGLANLLGLMPKGDLTGLPDAGYEGSVNPGPKGDDSVLVPDTLGPKPVANSPGPAGGGAGGALGQAGAAGAGGGVPGLFSAGGSSAAPSAISAGGDLDLEGGFAPDIYPWRKERLA